MSWVRVPPGTQKRKAAMLSFFLFIEILDILESLRLLYFLELIAFRVVIKKRSRSAPDFLNH